MSKVCNTCSVEKDESRFRPQAAKCRACAYLKKLEWQRNNPDKLRAGLKRAYRRNKTKILAQMKEHRVKNAAVIRARRQAARKDPNSAAYQARFGTGREHYLARKRKHNARARPKQRAYVRLRCKTDPNFHLRRSLCRFLREGVFEGSRTAKVVQLLGCSIDSFRMYLESKFESGMTWDNYGKGGWEIDHELPLAIFDLTNPEHQKRAFHFSNLQPMWGVDNRAKGAKVLDPQFKLI